MMRVLGAKRVMILAVLVAANALFAALVYGYMFPEKLKLERTLRGLQGQINTVEADISRLHIEFDQLEDQQARFEALDKDGFFRTQDRRLAEDLIVKIRNKSGVKSAVASIEPGVLEDNEEAEKASYKVLASDIKLTIEALDDVEIYKYLYLMEKVFPGHISVNKIEMRRGLNLSAAVLRAISLGESPPLVEANIDLSWRTMIQESQVHSDKDN